jgi:small subunit ribosomal protein S9
MDKATVYGTGKRKTSVARVWLTTGDGKIRINGRSFENYIPRETLRNIALTPLVITKMVGQFDVRATVRGGGVSGQAGAIRHGIARALLSHNAGLRISLKRAGLLTRDPRMVERKKYGRRKARARFQFSKR